jgi:predicted permease
MNLTGWTLPDAVANALALGGRTILLLVVLALGVLFDVTLLRSARLAYTLALRMVLGVLLAAACVGVFRLEGSLQSVVLLGGLAPIGFSAVAIANREKLDRELAASAASMSVLLALAYVPLALWLLHPATG